MNNKHIKDNAHQCFKPLFLFQVCFLILIIPYIEQRAKNSLRAYCHIPINQTESIRRNMYQQKKKKWNKRKEVLFSLRTYLSFMVFLLVFVLIFFFFFSYSFSRIWKFNLQWVLGRELGEKESSCKKNVLSSFRIHIVASCDLSAYLLHLWSGQTWVLCYIACLDLSYMHKLLIDTRIRWRRFLQKGVSWNFEQFQHFIRNGFLTFHA